MDYLGRADSIPHRKEGEAALLEFLPPNMECVLDLGSAGGRLLEIVKTLFAAGGICRDLLFPGDVEDLAAPYEIGWFRVMLKKAVPDMAPDESRTIGH